MMWLLVGGTLLNGIGALLLTRWLRAGMAGYAPPEPVTLRPQVIIPATGTLDNLEQLRDALRAQHCAPASLLFAVESRADPAFARIAGLFPESEVVVAGQAVGGSQKTCNQAAALRSLGEGGCLVLADADVVPQPGWLAHLVQPIARGRADIVTGYRWPIPTDAAAATLIGTWIDRGIAGLIKGANNRLLWGGSIAIGGAAAAALDLPAVLEPAITDDLALAQAARAKGLRILFRGAVLVPTPFAHGFRTLHAFGKRQYQLVRLYSPGFWVIALALTGLNLAGTTAATVLAFRSWTGTAAWALVVVLALANARERREQARAAAIALGRRSPERWLLLLVLILPLVHLCHLAMILGGLERRTVRWGRYRYRMRGRHVVAVERRA